MTTRLLAPGQKWLSAILLALSLMSIPAALAADDARGSALDALFIKLQAAPTPAKANQISGMIWQIWTTPTDPELADLMLEARTSKSMADITRTFGLITEMTKNFPDYAEAWNLRATMQYELGNYKKSLADIAETLAREPRHFGALSGQALVHLALGNRAKARLSVLEARKYHPYIGDHPPFSDLVEPVVRI